MRFLILLTTIAFAGLLGMRFGGDLVGLITDWRLWVSAAGSAVLWGIVGSFISSLQKDKKSAEGQDNKDSAM